jgi:hypothetical protein
MPPSTSARKSATKRPQRPSTVDNNATPSLQSGLNERSFGKYLKGYEPVEDLTDLLEARGGRVRYALETLDPSGRVDSVQYRLGGILKSVDPKLRYLRLFNPYAKASWSVQLQPGPGKNLRLYYMAPGTSDEISTMRDLLQKLENGQLVIKKVG